MLITADTKKADPHTWEKVRQGPGQGGFTHLLLGLEQAASVEFRSILALPTFSAQVAILAIDELHTVASWADFRDKFTLMADLRRSVGQSVPIFGCTATLTQEQEALVKESVGFRPEGLLYSNLKVIWVCID